MREYRNIRDRIGKKRPNRVEVDIMNAIDFYLEQIQKDIQGVLPTRLAGLTATSGETEFGLSPVFDPKQHYYIVHIPNDLTAVTLTAGVDGDTTATGDGAKAGLTVGTNAFTITASSNMRPDGYYKVIVSRTAADTTAYDAIVAQVGALVEGEYTVESWGLYQTAIALTNLTLTATDGQNALDAEVIEIQAALDLLVAA